MLQVRYTNLPTQVNFFLTDSEDVAQESDSATSNDGPSQSGSASEPDNDGDPGYSQTVSRAMAGTWHLPPSQWVFLLCGAFTVMICDASTRPEAGVPAFKELRLPGNHTVEGQIRSTNSADLCLVRWTHRMHFKALLPVTAANEHAGRLIDPLATAGGCDSLLWARQGEVGSPPGFRQLNDTINEQVKAYRGTEAPLRGEKRSSVEIQKDRAVLSARAAIRQFQSAAGRFRANDAFADRAYCDVQDCSVAATPVAVLPDFASSKVQTSWTVDKRVHVASTDTFADLQAFTKTQGFLLCNYDRLRLHLLINPRHSGAQL